MPQIYGYALSGVGRTGAERSGYTSPRVFVAINGVQYATARLTDANKVVDGSLSITEVLNETPNTAALTMMGAEPPEGSDVVITLGSINNLDRLYAGTVLNRTHAYVDTPASWHSAMNVIDYTWQLTRRKVSGLFTNVSPAVVAAAIVAAVPGFTLKVAAGLPTLDTFSFTDVDALAALTQLAQRIGGYCDVDYHKVVKLFLTDASVTNPTDLTAAHVSLSEFSFTRDLSQVRTRVFVEGGGVNALAACVPGETILPVESTAWYDPGGGKVKSGPQHIGYTGFQAGGAGALVGIGVAPSTSPTLDNTAGGSIDAGLHQWAYTWKTAAGETKPSPLLTALMAIPAPPAPDGVTTGAAMTGGPRAGAIKYALLLSDQATGSESIIGPTVSYTALGNHHVTIAFTVTAGMILSYGVSLVRFARSDDGGATWNAVPPTNSSDSAHALAIGPSSIGLSFTFDDTTLNAGSLAWVPPTSAQQSTTLLNVAVGPSGVTSRRIWRTKAGAAQLQLVGSIADNTTLFFASDAIADASLGVNAPTSDTSGLTAPAGQANAGDTSLLVTSIGDFFTTGGWVILPGGQAVRYTGIAGSSLIGIPASGPGAILTTIPYGGAAAPAAALIGVPASGPGAIVYPILQGDAVNLLVQVDDLAAQAALAALLGGTDDGVVEDYIQDGSIGETEALARGRARLAQASVVLVSVSFKTRDRNTHAGRTIHVNLGSPTSVTADFQIQQVTIDTFGPALLPTYTVQASSARFSLEDLLRVFRQAAN